MPSLDRVPADSSVRNTTQGHRPARRKERRPSRYHAQEVIADKYRLIRMIARGGMGEVWRAKHTSLNTDLAIKFLDNLPKDDPENVTVVRERFRFEAQISARLGARTKHIVAVQDAGSYDGVPYLAMEYVEGRTLESIIDELGMVTAEKIADVLEQAADALRVAHEMGIVHRDLKPSNLMLVDGPNGESIVKVADFGVAKAIRTDLAVDRPSETSSGLLVGSPAYMSPEQLRADGSLDARSDVWALGVVAYEALTGWPPFAGSNIADLIVAISTRVVDAPSSIRSTLPPAVDAWFERALAKDPEQRFQSVSEMAVAFRQALAPVPKRKPQATVVIGAVVAAVLLLGLVVWRVVSPRSASADTTTPVETAAPLAAATTTEEPAPPAAQVPAPAAEQPAETAPPAAKRASPRTPTRAPTRARGQQPAPPAATAEPKRRKEIDPSEIQ